MSIFSIWGSQFPAESAVEGLQITEAIWQDMPSYEGSLHHDLFVDDADPGHRLVVSEWASRDRADAVLRE